MMRQMLVYLKAANEDHVSCFIPLFIANIAVVVHHDGKTEPTPRSGSTVHFHTFKMKRKISTTDSQTPNGKIKSHSRTFAQYSVVQIARREEKKRSE